MWEDDGVAWQQALKRCSWAMSLSGRHVLRGMASWSHLRGVGGARVPGLRFVPTPDRFAKCGVWFGGCVGCGEEYTGS